MKNFVLLILTCMCLSGIIDAVPAQILIIRHAERDKTSPFLSTKGRERAAAMVPFFMENKDLLNYGSPMAIYAPLPSRIDPSELCIQTIRPLAEALRLNIKINYERDDYKRLVDEIMTNPSYNGKMVLICWEHTVIPEMARAFKAFQTPNKWQPEIFDRIWEINIATTGKVTFHNLPQRLLYGDSAN